MNRERRIIVIQPNRKDSKSTASRTKLRVAAYCRVSTEEEEQQGSFEIQKEFYTAKINSTPNGSLPGFTPMMASQVSTPKSAMDSTR